MNPLLPGTSLPAWILDARGFPMPQSGTVVGKTHEVQHPYKRDRRPYGPKERKPAPAEPRTPRVEP